MFSVGCLRNLHVMSSFEFKDLARGNHEDNLKNLLNISNEVPNDETTSLLIVTDLEQPLIIFEVTVLINNSISLANFHFQQ
jgi:hypothetical protein